mgnify:CR=1 FL=1
MTSTFFMFINHMKYAYFILSIVVFLACSNQHSNSTTNDFHISGEMKNVMWKGMLEGIIQLDTIPLNDLYGIGPIEYLSGEILVVDGVVYTSRISQDSSLMVEVNPKIKAPFFVHAHQKGWSKTTLPDHVIDLQSLENFIDSISTETSNPLVFKLSGVFNTASIHVQNLPPNTEVHSPKEAHQGQVNLSLGKDSATIVGFFSRKHQGVFTHHDSYIHTHYINGEKTKMGHLDKVSFNPKDVFLYMPN